MKGDGIAAMGEMPGGQEFGRAVGELRESCGRGWREMEMKWEWWVEGGKSTTQLVGQTITTNYQLLTTNHPSPLVLVPSKQLPHFR